MKGDPHEERKRWLLPLWSRLRLRTLHVRVLSRPGGRMDSGRNEHSPDPAALAATPAVVAILVDNHRRFLDFLTRRVGSRDVAEDILQDAFVRGLGNASQLRDRDSVIAWFYRSLRNALVDHWRKSRSEKRIFDDSHLDSDSEPATDPELMKTVCECAVALLEP